jgi:hypothetical protein
MGYDFWRQLLSNAGTSVPRGIPSDPFTQHRRRNKNARAYLETALTRMGKPFLCFCLRKIVALIACLGLAR